MVKMIVNSCERSPNCQWWIWRVLSASDRIVAALLQSDDMKSWVCSPCSKLDQEEKISELMSDSFRALWCRLGLRIRHWRCVCVCVCGCCGVWPPHSAPSTPRTHKHKRAHSVCFWSQQLLSWCHLRHTLEKYCFFFLMRGSDCSSLSCRNAGSAARGVTHSCTHGLMGKHGEVCSSATWRTQFSLENSEML